MTPAERMQRYRWMKAILKGMCDRWRTKAQVNMMKEGPADMVALQLAGANFDWGSHKANYARWNEINERVLDQLARLENEFAHFRNQPAT